MAQRRRSGGKQQFEAQTPSLSARMLTVLPDATVWALLFARWLLPTEGSAQGETLWLTSLTLFAAALIGWARSRQEPAAAEPGARSLTKLDWSALLLCGAHVLAGLLVLINGGNRRTALNLGWEWTALGVLFLLLRSSCRGGLKPVLLRAVTALWIALAGYGLWQNAVWYPATLQAYEQARDRYDAALTTASRAHASAADQRELRQAAAALAGDGVPLSGSARELFERRLRDSQEPLGFFALANSFAGCLAVVVVLLTVLLIRELLQAGGRTTQSSPETTADSRRSRAVRLLAILLPLLLTAACLILTKSRTAWCGTLAGLGLAAVLSLLGNRSAAAVRRGLVIGGGLTLVLGGLVVAATLTGGLDPNVVREAPKSLKYRLEYWTGALAVIGEQPLLGVGPGQFRDAYLRHKLPESSEEIADPHQLFLDVWANAGLPALLGLLGVAVFAGSNMLTGSRSHDSGRTELQRGTSEAPVSGNVSQSVLPAQTQPNPVHPTGAELTGLLALLLAGGLVVAAKFVLEARIDGHVLTVAGLAAVCWWLLPTLFAAASVPSTVVETPLTDRSLHIGLSCGLAALGVHLLGAGGIAMPAVVGLLLLLTLLTAPAHSRSSTEPPRPPRVSHETLFTAGAVAAAVLSVACSLTGFVPDQSRRSLLAAGDFEAAQGRAVPQAERLYREAAAADVLSPEPWLRLSEVAFRQWSTTGSESEFEHGLTAAHEALRRSPHTASTAHHIGHWLYTRAERDASTDLARESVEWLNRAVTGYPTEPQWLADLALARHLSGDTHQAATTAQQALDLDSLNRTAGHIDRYLDEATLRRLADVAESAQAGPIPTGQSPAANDRPPGTD